MKKLTYLILAVLFFSFFNACKSKMDLMKVSVETMTDEEVTHLIGQLNQIDRYAVFDLGEDQTLGIKQKEVRYDEALKKVKNFQANNSLKGTIMNSKLQYWVIEKSAIINVLKVNENNYYDGLAFYPAMEGEGPNAHHTLIIQPTDNLVIDLYGEVLSHELVDPASTTLYNIVDPCPAKCDNVATKNALTER